MASREQNSNFEVATVQDPQQKRPRILCVAPAWNEGERISRVVKSVPSDVVETTVVIDDGSTDDTPDHAENAGASVIRAGKNRGVGAAIRSEIGRASCRERVEISVVAASL